MCFWVLLIMLVFSSATYAKGKVSKSCLNAIHEHYLFTVLIEPNIKTIPKKKQEKVQEKGETLLTNINRECEASLAAGIQEKTKNFSIPTSDYLKYFEQDVGVNLSFVGQTIPLNQANMSDQELKVWASLVLLKTYEITAKKFKDFSHLKSHYNPSALQKVAEDIYRSYLQGRSKVSVDNQITIIDKALAVHSNIVSLPHITFQGVDKNGRYMWRLKIPMLIQARMGDRIKKEKIKVSIQVTRVEQSLAADGIVITQFEIEFE